MDSVKITNRDRYNTLLEIIEKAQEGIEGYDYEDLTNFLHKAIDQLDKKAQKAKENASAKKAEKDELCSLVESYLTDEPQTREDIANQIAVDGVTVAKVGYRLSKLVTLGSALRTEITVPGVDGGKARKVVAYTKGVIEGGAS